MVSFSRRVLAKQGLQGCWLLTLALVGCGKTGPIAINPTFLYDDKPLTEASISFVRSEKEQGRPAYGVTDVQGKATLTTYQPDDGVLPGTYRVVVIKPPENPMTFVEDNSNLTDPNAYGKIMASAAAANKRRTRRVVSIIPEVYADPGTTPLTCTVSADELEPKFELSSKAK
jgi:hypothetical protein